jgi:hypothetical protein
MAPSALDAENETGCGGALPPESANGAGAGHEGDTQEAQCEVQSLPRRSPEAKVVLAAIRDDRVAELGSSEPDLQLEEAAARRRGECFRGRRCGGGGNGQRSAG